MSYVIIYPWVLGWGNQDSFNKLKIKKMKIGTKGTITYGDGSTSRVELEKILTYPATGMPADYLFKYDADETHRPLIQSLFDGSFSLPEGLVSMVFKED